MDKNFRVFINFKTYKEGTGENALKLAKICWEVQEEQGGRKGLGIEIIPIVQTVDLYRTKQAVKIPVWVQSVDFQLPGQATGWTSLESVIEAGASGTLLNHSEHSLPPGSIKQVLRRIRVIGENKGFEAMVCCKTLGQMERLIKLKPDFIAYEISELIGGKVSIIDSDPKTIKHAVEICGQTPLIVGAGVHKAEDLARAGELGARGVLISSAVVLAKDQKTKLLALLQLLK